MYEVKVVELVYGLFSNRKYPSELNWSSLGDVLGFIYITEGCTDQAML